MCGICGFSGHIQNKEQVLEQMKNRIIHRGPDDDGSFINDEIALGFRRLSIIDLDHGAQPMKNKTETVVVFNGEIYNYKELRSELEAMGYEFENNSDTETLVHGYEAWGEELPKHLRGMFAFVIYDKEKRSLFGARDFFGIKPFYYSVIDNNFVFGSECKSILEYPGFQKEVNLDALEQYLSFQYSVLEETFFKGIYKLPPAHQFTFAEGKLAISRYWEADFSPNHQQSLDESIKKISSIMESSTAAHQIADVEVGSLLSSGIDSSYIVALGRPDKTFTVGFDYEKFNEIPYAKELSDTLGVNHFHQIISTKEYWDSLSKIQYYMDEPLADASAVALYFVDKLASQHVKVVLSGEGADELFGGYVIYHEPLSLKKYQKIPKVIRKGISSFAKKFMKEGVKGRSFLIRGGMDLKERFIGNAYRFNEEEKKALLKRPLSGLTPQDLTAPIYNKVQHLDEPTQMQAIDLNFWLIGDILLKGDKMSMANSLETRVPFLDKEVFKIASEIPLEHKITSGTTKYALRQSALSKIPAKSATRPKLGFPVPTGIWLQTDEYYHKVKDAFTSKAAEEFFHTDYLLYLLDSHKSGSKDYSKHIWTVYMFLLWYDVYFTNPMSI